MPEIIRPWTAQGDYFEVIIPDYDPGATDLSDDERLAALRRYLQDRYGKFTQRWGFDPSSAIEGALRDGDYELEGGTTEQRALIRDLLSGYGDD